MNRILRATLISGLIVLTRVNAAPLVTYTFDGGSAAGSGVDVNISAGDYFQGDGLINGFVTEGGRQAIGGGENSWGLLDASPTLASAIADDQYFGFTMTPNEGYLIDFDNVMFLGWMDSIARATEHSALFSSVGGFTDGDEIDTSVIPSNDVYMAQSFDLSGPEFDKIETTIEFRVYMWGKGSSPNSTSEIAYDDFIFNGTAARRQGAVMTIQ